MSKYSTAHKMRTANLGELAEMVAEGTPVYVEVFQELNGRMQYRWMRVRSQHREGRRVALVLSDVQRVVGNADARRRYVNTPPVR